MRPDSGPRLYLAASFAARLAEEGMSVGLVLLAVERTGSAAQGAFALTAWTAPHVLAAPLTGGVAARARRPRPLYAGALAGFAVAIAGVALLMGRAPAPATFAVALAGGAFGPVVSGGLSSLVAVLVPEGGSRDRAYALDAAGYNAASVAGPAVVGLVTALASAGAAALAMAAAAGAAALLAAALPLRQAPPPPSAPTLRAGLAAGLAAVWRDRELRGITAATCLAHVGIGGLTGTAVLLAISLGHADGGGVLMTASAVGALGGSLAVARWLPSVPARTMAVASLAAHGTALTAAAFAPSYPVCVALFAVAGAADGPLLAATLRVRADHAPPRLRTQVFTLGAGLKITAAAAGAALTGAAASLRPSLLLLAIAALQFAAVPVYGLARSGRRRAGGTRGPTGPSPSGREPDQRVTPSGS